MSEANKAVMWAAKGINNNEIKTPAFTHEMHVMAIMVYGRINIAKTERETLETTFTSFFPELQIVQVEVREIVNPETTQP